MHRFRSLYHVSERKTIRLTQSPCPRHALVRGRVGVRGPNRGPRGVGGDQAPVGGGGRVCVHGAGASLDGPPPSMGRGGGQGGLGTEGQQGCRPGGALDGADGGRGVTGGGGGGRRARPSTAEMSTKHTLAYQPGFPPPPLPKLIPCAGVSPSKRIVPGDATGTEGAHPPSSLRLEWLRAWFSEEPYGKFSFLLNRR